MWRDRVALCVVVVFAVAACFYAAVALGWLSLGRAPGDDPPGAVFVAAALLAAVVASLALAILPSRAPAYALIPPAVGAWVVAHYYTYDSYNLPSKTRYSEQSSISAVWIFGLLAVGLVLGAGIRRWPRLGVLMIPFVILCAATTIGEGLH